MAGFHPTRLTQALLGVEVTDELLEQKLYRTGPTKQGHRRHPKPVLSAHTSLSTSASPYPLSHRTESGWILLLGFLPALPKLGGPALRHHAAEPYWRQIYPENLIR